MAGTFFRTTAVVLGMGLIAALTACGTPSGDEGIVGSSASPSAPASTPTTTENVEVAALETRYDARIGVVARNLETGAQIAHRADERFAFASTNKTMIVLAMLDATDDEDLDAIIHYDEGDLLEYAPVTSQHVDTGMSIRDLCKAAIDMSDNTAANLVMDQVGGPAAVESYLRSLGDETISVDRTEPTLNDVRPGETHDTTTPAAMSLNLERVVRHDGIDVDDSAQLREWMQGNTTGDDKIRAGVPDGWTVADKTGSSSFYDISNDVAIVESPSGEPYVITIYTRQLTEDGVSPDNLIAEVARVVFEELG